MLTTRQVAEQLQVLPVTIERWLRQGKLSGVRIGSRRAGWRIPESELARLLSGRKHP
jgi:excisionase family DNA binding protein